MADPILRQIVERNSDVLDALTAGQHLCEPRKNPHPEGDAYAVVPIGSNLQYLTRPAFPRRRSGTVNLFDAASFLEYWKRQSTDGSYLYGSMQPAQFTAVLNEHVKDQPNWRDHRAIYPLQHSKEWMEWTKRNGQPFAGNEAFAVWLEENLIDVVRPDPAKFMDLSLNFRVNQTQGFSNAVRLQDGNIDLTYSNVVEGGSTVQGRKVQIPEAFAIFIPVWEGINAKRYQVEARFRYRLQSGALAIRFELVRPHKVIEQSFKDLLALIEKEAKSKVLFGTPE